MQLCARSKEKKHDDDVGIHDGKGKTVTVAFHKSSNNFYPCGCVEHVDDDGDLTRIELTREEQCRATCCYLFLSQGKYFPF